MTRATSAFIRLCSANGDMEKEQTMSQKKYITLDPNKLGSRSAALRKHLCESVIGQPEACESVVRVPLVGIVRI